MPLLKTGFRSNIKYIIIILFLSIIRSILSVTQVTIFREFMIKFSSNNTEIKEQTFFSKFSHINKFMEEINKNENLLDKNEKLDENEIEKMEIDYPKEVKEYGFIDKDPYTSSSFISNLFYHWAYKIIKLS